MSGAGAYGKIPSNGDFLTLRLDRRFVMAWDDWLQSVIPEAKAALGDRWQAAYMSAPIWRFTLAPGVAGTEARIGVMMASVDRVGRQFPLMIASVLHGDPAVAHFTNDRLFDAMEGAALAVLEDDARKERLEFLLVELPPPQAPVANIDVRGHVVTATSGHRDGLRAALAGTLLGKSGQGGSYWSSDTGEGVRFLSRPGLPTARDVAGFFDVTAPLWSEAGAL